MWSIVISNIYYRSEDTQIECGC